MPVEILDNIVANSEDALSQTVAPAGHVSVWCVNNGPATNGFRSADTVMQNGLPFGHGDRRTVRGFQVAKVAQKKMDEKGKESVGYRPNIVKGPSGVELIELYVDEESMIAKQKFEAEVSNAQVASAKGAAVNGSSSLANDPENPDIIRGAISGKFMTDEQRQILEDKQLAEVTQHAP